MNATMNPSCYGPQTRKTSRTENSRVAKKDYRVTMQYSGSYKLWWETAY